MDHSVVQRWLRSVIGPYIDKDRVFADVDRTLLAVSSLSPKTEVFTFNDGRTQLLLTLEGTIPVQFRNATYNIPVAYWVLREYPRAPPIGFVVPTADMGIRKGPHVDPDGQIGGEYLRRWNSKPEACNLLDFVHDCQAMFGREPPVFAKPKTPVSPSGSKQPQYASAPSPLTPRPSQTSMLTPSSSVHAYNNGSPVQDARTKPPPPAPQSGQSQAAPHRPPKPPTPGASPYYSPGPRSSLVYNEHASPSRSNTTPTERYRPAGQDQTQRVSGPDQYAAFNMQPRRSSSINVAGPGPHSPQPLSAGSSPSQRPWEQQQPVLQGPLPAQYAPQHDSQQSNHRYSYQQQPPVTSQQQQQQQAPPVPTYDRSTPSVSQNGFRASMQQPSQLPVRHTAVNLLDDDDDGSVAGEASAVGANGKTSGAPPPPRPMNPELLAMHDRLFAKLDSRLASLSSSLENSNQQLRVLSSDLDRGRPAIDDEMSRLKAVRDVCQTTGDRLEETVVQARERVSMLRQKEDPDPDTMVMATSIVGNQLIDLVAEDNAIGDTLYQLGRALNAERIDFDRFLKQTRMLAREQFMKRALAHKISEGMGWS